MEKILQIIQSANWEFEIPETITQIGATALQYGKFLGLLILGVLLLSSLTRLLFGKENQINLAITAAMEILCLYVINIVICALGLDYKLFLSPLPFVGMSEDYLYLFPLLSADMPVLYNHLLRLLIIAFLVNLIGGLIPQGQNLLTWTILRLITVAFSVAALYGVDLLCGLYLPQGFGEYAPTILVLSLAALIALGSLKLLVGAALSFLDPIIGALYTFFFSNVVGRALARAMVSCLLISGLLLLANWLGITALHIAAEALKGYIPLLAVVVLLWYFVGRVLKKH
ncbi:MAG: hypothetical protein E7438_03000 [Ruminococcaceae bacterium]|nr:hypothetical protein [Oscillospiraceae bacterium]